MLNSLFNNPAGFLLWFIALITAISIHEFAHAYAADRLGDPTPRLMGRLTLNPLAHLDLLGTLLMVFARFGWGKPVQFDPFNLRNPRRDSALISLAGPASNITLAIAASIIRRILANYSVLYMLNPVIGLPILALATLLEAIIIMNVVLGIFNLVPVHPLDGFKIVEGILPPQYAKQWHQLQPYGFLILIYLLIPFFGHSSPIDTYISPVIDAIIKVLAPTSNYT